VDCDPAVSLDEPDSEMATKFLRSVGVDSAAAIEISLGISTL